MAYNDIFGTCSNKEETEKIVLGVGVTNSVLLKWATSMAGLSFTNSHTQRHWVLQAAQQEPSVQNSTFWASLFLMQHIFNLMRVRMQQKHLTSLNKYCCLIDASDTEVSPEMDNNIQGENLLFLFGFCLPSLHSDFIWGLSFTIFLICNS